MKQKLTDSLCCLCAIVGVLAILAGFGVVVAAMFDAAPIKWVFVPIGALMAARISILWLTGE
jgi:hypothetical protein